MPTLSSMLRKGNQLQSTRNQAGRAGQTARKSEGVQRIIRILNDVCSDPEKFCRIVRSQMGRHERMLFTYNQINHRAMEGDLDACEVVQEYIRQERADGIPEEVTDEQILSLWKEGVTVGRIFGCNPFKLANFYNGKGREGAKPFVALQHWAKALQAVADDIPTLEENIFNAMNMFHEAHLSAADSMEDAFERVAPGFKAEMETEESTQEAW
jgi:hypothetical protein